MTKAKQVRRTKLDKQQGVSRGMTGTVGSSGLEQWGGIIDEEWHRNLQGVKGTRVYREMYELDDVVGATYGIVRDVFKQATRTIVPAKPNHAGAKKWADFVESALADMSHTEDQMHDEIFTMMPYGWAYMEKTLKQRLGHDNPDPSKRSRYDDGLIGWRKIELRSQTSLERWQFDDNGGIEGMWQNANNAKSVFIPIEKSVLFRINAIKNNPEGMSGLKKAYRPWLYRKRHQELEAIRSENDATGIPVLQCPPELLDSSSSKYDAALIARLEKKVVQIRRGERQGIVVPAELDADGNPTGWKLGLLRNTSVPQSDSNEIIQRCRAEIAIATFYAGFLFLGEGAHGSFALGESKTNLFTSAVGSVLGNIAETFTRFCINPLMEVNGVPRELWPTMRYADIETQPLDKLSNFVSKLAMAGVVIPTPALEQALLEQADLPVSEHPDDAMGLPQRAFNPQAGRFQTMEEEDAPEQPELPLEEKE